METLPAHPDNPAAKPQARGLLKQDEVMSRHTSWKVGGPADRFYIPAGEDDLVRFLAALPDDEPVTWIGLGSNVLVRDGGIRGTVVASSGMKDKLALLPDNRVSAGCGAACAKVARFKRKIRVDRRRIPGRDPGSVGGALTMNAGAFGSETWSIVDRWRRGRAKVCAG